jgi:di/tripeptidase
MINPERLVNTFLDLVQIDSPSGGEKEIAEYVAAKLGQKNKTGRRKT